MFLALRDESLGNALLARVHVEKIRNMITIYEEVETTRSLKNARDSFKVLISGNILQIHRV